MSPKAILLFCAQALLAQTAFSQCSAGFPGPYGLGGFNGYNGLGGYGFGGGYGAGCGCGATGVASTGGGLPVASASPIAPVGVSVLSENVYEGSLAAGGNLPFLGSVGIEGVLPTAGTGAVSYGCGDGAVAIGSEGPYSTGITVPGAIFPPGSPSSVATADALSLVPGIAGPGFGYNGLGGYGFGGAAGYGHGGAGYGFGGISGYGLGGFNGCGCGSRI